LTISILLLVYTFYKSEIYWDGIKRDYYFTYYIISSVLILFSTITFYISEKIKTYLIITLSSVVFSLYIFEAYLTEGQYFYLLGKKIKLYKEQTGKNYDTREQFEVYNDLRKEDKNVVVAVTPKIYLNESNIKIFPITGISYSKTLYCNENGYYFIYESDRYGFNNPDEEWDKEEIEYLFVGDSYIQGACVNRPNDIASVLRTLSKKTVLNLGHGGVGPLIEYAILREYLKLNVKNVFWVYYERNDISNLNDELKSKILIQYLQNLNFTQNLKSKQNQIDELAKQIIEREKKKEEKENSLSFKAFKFIKIYHTRHLLFYFQPELQTELVPQFKEILKLAKDLATKNNSNFYFVYLPGYTRYKTYYDNSFYNEVKQIVEKLSIPFIDIHKEVFEKESNPLKLFPFELGGHYNVEGYRKVAEAIYKFISTK